ACGEPLLGALRLSSLLGRVVEDRRAVLRAVVRSLTVELRGIVQLPERVEQLIVGYFLRIVGELHDFRVSGSVRADIFVRGIVERAAQITDARIDHAGDLAKV